MANGTVVNPMLYSLSAASLMIKMILTDGMPINVLKLYILH